MERINLSGSPQSTVQSLITSNTAYAAKDQPDERSMADNVMDRLNQRMAEIYGHRWTSAYTRESLDTWAKGLGDMTVERIKCGVEACIAGAHAWPPTLPEFRDLCLTIPGLPSSDEAWDEAKALAAKWKPSHECSHPVIWHAYTESNLADTDEETGRKRFRRNYQIASQMYAAGGVDGLTKIPLALPRQSVVPPSPEEIAEKLRYADEKLAALGLGKRAAP